jgi:alkaline phosphatase D
MDQTYDRRSVLRAGAAGVVLGAGSSVVAVAVGAPAASAAEPVFAHGVASGDPLPDAVLLWTRVTPTPDATPGSGVGPTVDVTWEVAADPAFASVVGSGVVSAGPGSDHTVKADATGLNPATTYYYRFRLGGAVSSVGTTRTAPAPTASVSRLRFGVVSCSNVPAGYFAAYRYLAERGDLDAVLHLGDYIYEYAGDFNGAAVRPHDPPREVLTLNDYRQRHAQYKTDEHLQRLHATVPFIATWDDHEVANDAWSGGAENHQPDTEGDYATRKAAAHQAYFEWMPVRHEADRIYRRLRFGLLTELFMLDLRSYRSQQVAVGNGGADDPTRTMTGPEQMSWLENGLVTSEAQWKLVGNSVMIAPFQLPPLSPELLGPLAELLGLPSEGLSINPDQWDGYAADRRRLLATIANNHVRDTVFLTGDIHSSWASDVPRDAGLYPLSPSVATEFVCTSVTSDNIDDILGVPPRTVSPVAESAIRVLNRHIKYVELDSHGASVLEVTPSGTQMDWYYLANKADPASTLTWARSFRTRAGTQRVASIGTPIGN